MTNCKFMTSTGFTLTSLAFSSDFLNQKTRDASVVALVLGGDASVALQTTG